MRCGLGGVELPAGEDEVEGPAEADDAGQAVGAAVDQRHAPAPLEAAEAGRVARRPAGRTTAASSSPPATHQPSTAAITGFDSCSRVGPSGPTGRSRGRSLRSAPAQNAVLVAGEDRDPFAPRSASKARNASCSRLGGRAVDGVAHARAGRCARRDGAVGHQLR